MMGKETLIYFLITIIGFILILASFNFLNLPTKEVKQVDCFDDFKNKIIGLQCEEEIKIKETSPVYFGLYIVGFCILILNVWLLLTGGLDF
jgi:hypothetical protein